MRVVLLAGCCSPPTSNRRATGIANTSRSGQHVITGTTHTFPLLCCAVRASSLRRGMRLSFAAPCLPCFINYISFSRIASPLSRASASATELLRLPRQRLLPISAGVYERNDVAQHVGTPLNPSLCLATLVAFLLCSALPTANPPILSRLLAAICHATRARGNVALQPSLHAKCGGL